MTLKSFQQRITTDSFINYVWLFVGPKPVDSGRRTGSTAESGNRESRLKSQKLERVEGIEPPPADWKSAALALSYTRKRSSKVESVSRTEIGKPKRETVN